MFGILNIDKPQGVTSRAVVSAVQRGIRPAKAGHAGTLDPLATGVLLVCVGPATRLVPYVQRLKKQYLATFLLGRSSPSDDVEEEVTLLEDAPVPTSAELQAVLPQFVGSISQQPPNYSALKVGGKRAYQLVRQGADPQLQPRTVCVDDIQVVSYDYPQLTVSIDCGSGTYVRSLGRDIAAAVGTHAVMSALQRTAIGDFQVDNAWRISAGERPPAGTIRAHVQPATRALGELPHTTVDADDLRLLANGRPIRRAAHGWSGEVAALDDRGQLVAILAPAEQDQLRPVRNFATAS